LGPFPAQFCPSSCCHLLFMMVPCSCPWSLVIVPCHRWCPLSSSPRPLHFLGLFLVILVVADSIRPWPLPLPLLFLLLPLPSLCWGHGGSGHADRSMALAVALALASFRCPFPSFLLSWCHLCGSCLTLHLWSSCHGVDHGAFSGVSKIQIPKIQ
jgi:hypothetical protein